MLFRAHWPLFFFLDVKGKHEGKRSNRPHAFHAFPIWEQKLPIKEYKPDGKMGTIQIPC